MDGNSSATRGSVGADYPEDFDEDLLEAELFGDLGLREAMHSYFPTESSRAKTPPRSDSAPLRPPALAIPSANPSLSSSHGSSSTSPHGPSPSTPAKSSSSSAAASSPPSDAAARQKQRSLELAAAVAAAPRPNMPVDLAREAGRQASELILSNPHLRGDDLLRALRKVEEDVVLNAKKMPETIRRANVTAHHAVTGGNVLQGFLSKQSGGRKNSMELSVGTWRERWFVLKDTCLAIYMTEMSTQVHDCLLFDASFQVEWAGAASKSVDFTVHTANRKLVLRAPTTQDCERWVSTITATASSTDFGKYHPNGSFAPMRSATAVSALVDGRDYFAAVGFALSIAASEIFIVGWWLNVDVPLRRGDESNGRPPQPTLTLREALVKATERGCKVYVLLYAEQAIAMPNNSVVAEEQLRSLSPGNIFVLRHPHRLDVGATLWSHHEKIVVVDRRVVFLGGVDLAPGRWDTSEHVLGPADLKHPDAPAVSVSVSVSAGGGASDPSPAGDVPPSPGAAKTTTSPTPPTPPPPQAPSGAVATTRQSPPPMSPGPTDASVSLPPLSTPIDRRSSSVSVSSSSGGVPTARDFLFPGVDYWNPRVCDYVPQKCGLKAWSTDSFDATRHPRMGWHDVSVMMSGGLLVSDVCRHFIQRWLYARADAVKKYNDIPALLPLTVGVVNAGGGAELNVEGIARNVDLDFSNQSVVNGQVLRSCADWSVGIEKIERSIYNCMLRLIEGASQFIYIENQYFCAGFGSVIDDDFNDEVAPATGGGGADVSGLILNGIALALMKRIGTAIENGEKFRVIVVMPHLAWENNPVQSTILHFSNDAIRTLLGKLGSKYPDVGNWSEYISFYNLRNYGSLGGGKKVTEEIYVHDKLMIVDDRIVLVGSANINDRSLLGLRDSEIAVLYHDVETFPSKMNGKHWDAGKFAHSLRMQLWKEHIGAGVGDRGAFDEADLHDPFGTMWDMFRRNAVNNRAIYEACFPTMYRDEYTKIRAIPRASSVCPEADESGVHKLEDIRGHLVTAAPFFLSEENLMPSVATKAYLMPLRMFI